MNQPGKLGFNPRKVISIKIAKRYINRWGGYLAPCLKSGAWGNHNYILRDTNDIPRCYVDEEPHV